MLMKISQYRRMRYVPGSAPVPKTIIKRIESGELPGEKIGGTWYIEYEPDQLRQKPSLSPEARRMLG